MADPADRLAARYRWRKVVVEDGLGSHLDLALVEGIRLPGSRQDRVVQTDTGEDRLVSAATGHLVRFAASTDREIGPCIAPEAAGGTGPGVVGDIDRTDWLVPDQLEADSHTLQGLSVLIDTDRSLTHEAEAGAWTLREHS